MRVVAGDAVVRSMTMQGELHDELVEQDLQLSEVLQYGVDVRTGSHITRAQVLLAPLLARGLPPRAPDPTRVTDPQAQLFAVQGQLRRTRERALVQHLFPLAWVARSVGLASLSLQGQPTPLI